MSIIANSAAPAITGSAALVSFFSMPSATQTATALAASISADSARNATLTREKAEQTRLTQTTPRILLISFAGMLLFCMLLQHPRFLARLLASLPGARKKKSSALQLSSPISPGSSSANTRVGGGELWKGWILRSGKNSSSDGKSDPFASPIDGPFSPFPFTTNQTPRLTPPPHITPLLSHLPYATALFYAPLARLPQPLTSTARLSYIYIVIAYIILIALALTWRSDVSEPSLVKGFGNDYARTGLVAVCQFPLVIALGVRGNVIGLCVGRSYERLKILHKVVGRVVVLASTLHVGFFMAKWTKEGRFWSSSAKFKFVVGYLAWAALVWLAVTSLPWIRKKFYGLFEISHTIGIVLLLAGCAMHVKKCVPWCFAAGLVYAFSLICSAMKTRLAHAEFVPLPSSTTTVITIPSLRTGWRAGQHVRIRVPALGWPGGFEGHPFTIASAPDGEGLVLMCKSAGNWTESLFKMASEGHTHEGPKTSTIILEGPYGGLGNTMLPAFSSVLLVAGGSGITHSLAIAHDLIMKAPTGVVRARTIDLVWLVKTEDVARPLLPTLLDLLNDAKAYETKCIAGRKTGNDLHRPTGLRIKIYVTRSPSSSPINLLNEHAQFNQSPTHGPIFDITEDMLYEKSRSNPFDDRHRYKEEYHGADPFADPSHLRRQNSDAEKLKQSYLSRNPSTSTCASTSSSTYLLRQKSPMSNISIHPGKPDFGGMLGTLADEVISKHGREMTDASGIVVVPCGPIGLVEGVKEGIRSLEGYKARAAGGVQLEEEVFGF